MDTFIAIVIIIGAAYFLYSRMKSKFSSKNEGCGCGSGSGCKSGQDGCASAESDKKQP